MILQEMKKIWRPSILAIIALMGALYFYLFLEYHIPLRKSGLTNSSAIDVHRELVERYGPSLEPDERKDAETLLPPLYAQAQSALCAMPEYATMGVQSEQDGIDLLHGEGKYAILAQDEAQEQAGEPRWGQESLARARADYRALHDALYFNDEFGWIGFHIQTIENLLERYDDAQAGRISLLDAGAPPSLVRRERDVLENGLWTSLLPRNASQSVVDYGSYVACWLIISCCMLLSPFLVRDRLTGVRQMQWSGRYGRRILRKQWLAAMLSAMLLTGIQLGVLGCIYAASNRFGVFGDCGLVSLDGGTLFALALTFEQYVGLICALSFVASMASASIVFFLSMYSEHYVAMIWKAIPLVVVLVFLTRGALNDLLVPGNVAFRMTGVVYAEFYVIGAIAVLAGMLALLADGWQMKKELR